MIDINDLLIHASQIGNLNEVKKLLKKGASVHYKTYDGSTALRRSALHGQTDIVRLLLENGANQSVLCKEWDNKRIAKEFLEINNCKPEPKHTDELCSVLFQPVKDGDWYIVWEDDSITLLENIHLTSVEPEIVKYVYIQC